MFPVPPPGEEPTMHVRPVDDDERSIATERLSMSLVLTLVGGVAAIATLFIAIALPTLGLIVATSLCWLFTLFAALRWLRGSLEDADLEVTERLKQPVSVSKRSRHSVLENEVVLLETRQHPLVLFWWIVGGVALQPLAVFAGVFSTFGAGLALWIIGMIAVGIRVLLWERDRICVSKQRLFATKGIFTIKRLTLPLPKLTDATVATPVLSNALAWLRIIKVQYGTLIVESAGQEQALNRLTFVPCIEQVGKIILRNVG